MVVLEEKGLFGGRKYGVGYEIYNLTRGFVIYINQLALLGQYNQGEIRMRKLIMQAESGGKIS
jgi:hypothetical protein